MAAGGSGATGGRTTWSRSSTAALPLVNGGLPTSISYTTSPRPYTSDATDAGRPSTRSGATYSAVAKSWGESESSAGVRAMPKSQILG
ncbi:MAG TPA: hypothetical protein VIN37_03035 [Candidatus Limnocylindria bacterium]